MTSFNLRHIASIVADGQLSLLSDAALEDAAEHVSARKSAPTSPDFIGEALGDIDQIDSALQAEIAARNSPSPAA